MLQSQFEHDQSTHLRLSVGAGRKIHSPDPGKVVLTIQLGNGGRNRENRLHVCGMLIVLYIWLVVVGLTKCWEYLRGCRALVLSTSQCNRNVARSSVWTGVTIDEADGRRNLVVTVIDSIFWLKS